MIKGFTDDPRGNPYRRMPPWHADPRYGAFKNNRALSTDNMKTLVHWIEAGAPRGQGRDPLAGGQVVAQMGAPAAPISCWGCLRTESAT